MYNFTKKPIGYGKGHKVFVHVKTRHFHSELAS